MKSPTTTAVLGATRALSFPMPRRTSSYTRLQMYVKLVVRHMILN